MMGGRLASGGTGAGECWRTRLPAAGRGDPDVAVCGRLFCSLRGDWYVGGVFVWVRRARATVSTLIRRPRLGVLR